MICVFSIGKSGKGLSQVIFGMKSFEMYAFYLLLLKVVLFYWLNL